MPLKLIKIKTSQNWYIRGTVKGQPVFRTSGTDQREIADAERIRLENEMLHSAVFGTRKKTTFGDAATAYLKAGGSARYLGEKKHGIWTGVLGEFIDTPLSQIGQTELDAAARRTLPGVNPQTLNRHFYTPFIAVWNFAAADDLCASRPWRRPRVKNSDKKRRRWFQPKEAAAFFDAAAPHLRCLFLFYILTGARTTEALELEIPDVDLAAQWAVLNAGKSEELRGIPLHPAVVAMLRECIGARISGRVFVTDDGRPYASHRKADGTSQGGGQFKTAWNNTLRRAGLSGLTPYSARHTFNNWLILAGVIEATREALMGHAGETTNSIYADVPQAELIRAVALLPDFTDFSRLKSQNLALFTQASTVSESGGKSGKKSSALKIKKKGGAVDGD